MRVCELLEQLQGLDPDAEVGWEVGSRDLELLIGEDPDTGFSVTIERPAWL